jgi:hypothetical protein
MAWIELKPEGAIQGLSALARDGATRAKLMAIADAAMRAWPD